MRRTRILTLALALLTAAFAAPMASADSFTLVNGGASVVTTYSDANWPGVTAQITWSLSGDKLTLTVKNTSSVAGISLSGIAFNMTPNYVASIFSQSGAISGWGSPGGAGGAGIVDVRVGNAGSCNSDGTVCTGEVGTIVFTLAGLTGDLTIDASSVHIQSIDAGGRDVSIKPTGTVTTVPEPASLFLMGTGLVGLGSIVRRRVLK